MKNCPGLDPKDKWCWTTYLLATSLVVPVLTYGGNPVAQKATFGDCWPCN
eukprot:CAMPEP_0204296674 /NCGR_PEP_ID=MMETSP0468-20130131/71852_1 /ASSEMBLY_ACC=CAM_ASM_000383 /TAXON_ID=2969 /ORGANISM="Oxyrrhis marina" /LENGTH=49 /DNA_ID=CAMNT_0051275399 /DNA_START=41 /DNA_END=190 /DNA_ORIENTATION=-